MINPEVIVEKAFCELVHPVFFRDGFLLYPLARTRGHAFEFGHGGLTHSGVVRPVL